MTRSDASFYDEYWKQDFVPPYLDSLLPAFARLGILPETKVLDIGCGNGALGELLMRTYHCQMYGTDVSPVALQAAAARGYSVELVDPGSSRRPFPDLQFDVVVLSAVLEHVFDPKALLAQAYAALKDGGWVVVLTPNITWFLNRILFALDIWEHPLLGGTEGHIRYLNKRMLESLLIEVGFRELDWSFSPMAVLPAGQDLFVRNRRVPLLRYLVGKRARRWVSLLAENFIVLGRKPITRIDPTQWAHLESPDRVRGLKVLHIAATASGANWMFEILCGLRARGYDVAALISSAHGELAGKLERAGIPYYVGDLDVFSALDLRGIARKVLKLARFLREHRFDIVHYHLFTSVILGRVAAWIADVPLRFSMITGPYYLEAPAPRAIDYRTLWMDTKVIASCEYTRQLYHKMGVPNRKIELIYYGADERRFDPESADPQKIRRELGIPAGDPLVGMVAYFYAPLPHGPWTPPHLQGRAIKGHETLLQAAPIVLKENPKVKFLLVGKGWETVGEQYEKDLKAVVKQMGLDKAVLFTGQRLDIPDVLASFDVSVQCALSENLGGTIESLLMARPTVATAVGGMVDTVRPEQTGVLVPPDAPQELAEAILSLLRNPERARRLGQNGRQLMLREFTLGKTVDDIDRLYQREAQRILKGRTKSRPQAYHYRIHRSVVRLTILALWGAFVVMSTLRLLRTGWFTKRGAFWAVAVWMYSLGRRLGLTRIRRGKRLMDVVGALSALIVFALPIALIACLIRLTMGSPVFVRQVRIGWRGQLFSLYKFRTTKEACCDVEGNALPDDGKAPLVGCFLRRTLLDKLPQLFNVLKGDMSLVGPRPLSPIEYLSLPTAYQARRQEVKPGITGWAFIYSRNALTLEERLNLDLWYVDHQNLLLDLGILGLTIWRLCKGKSG